MEKKFDPKNLKECNEVDWCDRCRFGDENVTPTNCERRLNFLQKEVSKIKTDSNKTHEDNKYLAYMWFNVRTVGQLREAMTLMTDDTKIDIDLRMVENLHKKTKELQFREPKEPRDTNIN